MQRIRSFLCLIFFCLILPHASAAFDPCQRDARAHYRPIQHTQPHTKTLLFRVERCGAKPSYVFGTMHSDSPEVLAIADPVIALLPNIRVAAFEYLEPDDATGIMQRAMLDPIGARPLSAQLTAGEWDILKGKLVTERGMPEAGLERVRPWAAAVMLQMPRMKHDGVILDDKLKMKMNTAGIRLMGLETMQEQMDIFSGMNQSQQIDMLKDTLVSLDQLDAMNDELDRSYVSNDLQRILVLGEAGFADIEDVALRDYLRTELLSRRNKHMAERAETELNAGGMLIAVGALHLPGSDGVLQLLENNGYFVFPVTAE